jgi:AAA domain
VAVADDNVHPLFEPDPVAIRQHLDRLFGWCDLEYPDGRIEIAWSDPGKFPVNQAENFPIGPDGLHDAATIAEIRNGEGRNVYVGVNPRMPGIPARGRAGAKDVEIALFQFAEVDKLESLERMRHPPVSFSFIVVTGTTPNSRPHGYYELSEPIRDLTAWRARQEALRDYFGGDNVVDPPRIMRLAGTVNYPAPHKIARGYRTEITTIYSKGGVVSAEDFDAAYKPSTDEQAKPEREKTTQSDDWFGEQDNIDTWFAAIDGNDHRHDNIRSLVARLVSDGYDRRIILALAPRLTFPGIDPAKTETKLREFIRSAEAKYGSSTNDDAAEDVDWDAEPPPLWRVTQLSEWAGRPIPRRSWVMEDWIPLGQCVGLYGIPGIQKTDFLLQLLMAASLGLPFCGIPLAHVRVYGLFCGQRRRDRPTSATDS